MRWRRAIHFGRRSKYGNVRVVLDGIRFDSKWERDYYQQLKAREAAGEIRGLQRQVKFDLRVNSVLVCRYVSDFTYEEREAGDTLCGHDWHWKYVVADCKSASTRLEPGYRLKRKLLRALRGIDILEVLRSKRSSGAGLKRARRVGPEVERLRR
mgnify:CR=1 FL=1